MAIPSVSFWIGLPPCLRPIALSTDCTRLNKPLRVTAGALKDSSSSSLVLEQASSGRMPKSTLTHESFCMTSSMGYRVQTLPLIENATSVRASRTELLLEDLLPHTTS